MKLKGIINDDIIEIKGKAIEEFQKTDEITEIIIKGKNGKIKKIAIEDE